MSEFLKGKKTHLLVIGLLAVTLGLDLKTPDGVDLETLQKALAAGLISTLKASWDRFASAAVSEPE